MFCITNVAMVKRKHDGGGPGGKGKKKGKGGGKGGGKAAGKASTEEAPEGERGFLVNAYSCDDAVRGVKDWRLWLEVEAEEGPEEAAEQPTTASVATDLDEELRLLREGGAAARRFLSVGWLCKQVAFLKTQKESDVPSALVKRFLGPKAEKAFSSRFAQRVVPVDASSRPKKENFELMARTLLAAHKGRTWRLFYEPFRGGWNTISRDDAMEMCKEVLSSEKLSVTEPEVTVVCTVQPRFVGLAVVELDAEDLQVPFDSEGAQPEE